MQLGNMYNILFKFSMQIWQKRGSQKNKTAGAKYVRISNGKINHRFVSSIWFTTLHWVLSLQSRSFISKRGDKADGRGEGWGGDIKGNTNY